MPTSSAWGRSFPTVRYLTAPFRWLSRSRRTAGTAGAVLLAMAAAFVLWWSLQLYGLPDVGGPFDGEELRSQGVPEDRDAFILYRQAADRFSQSRSLRYQAWFEAQLLGRWSAALPELQRWAEDKREALALFREAAERPDSTILSESDRARLWPALGHLRPLALFEAARLEERGDMAGAWTWYRAVLRTIQHQVAFARFAERKEAMHWRDRLRSAWSRGPPILAPDRPCSVGRSTTRSRASRCRHRTSIRSGRSTSTWSGRLTIPTIPPAR